MLATEKTCLVTKKAGCIYSYIYIYISMYKFKFEELIILD